jgi:hypothetical protein
MGKVGTHRHACGAQLPPWLFSGLCRLLVEQQFPQLESPYHEIRWMKVREAMSEMNLRSDEAYEWASMKLADTPAVRGARSATLTTPLENKCSGFIPFSCAAQLKPPTHTS